jgi:hypothetical protein
MGRSKPAAWAMPGSACSGFGSPFSRYSSAASVGTARSQTLSGTVSGTAEGDSGAHHDRGAGDAGQSRTTGARLHRAGRARVERELGPRVAALSLALEDEAAGA